MMSKLKYQQPVSWSSSEIILICKFGAQLLSIITGAWLLTMLFNQFENLFFQL